MSMMFPGEEDAGTRAEKAAAQRAAKSASGAPAAEQAVANQSQVAEVENAAQKAGGVVSGAAQDAVDKAVADTRSGVVSATDALAFLSKVFEDNKYKLASVTNGTDTEETPPADEPPASDKPDALNTLRAILADFDLSPLADNLYNKAISGEINYRDGNAVLYAARSEDLYKKRFAANPARAAKGLPELSPFDYLELEKQYRTTLRSQGMPTGFYDELSDFQSFIENDVSNAELKSRIESGYRVVQEADPAVKSQMRELYGVDDRGLAAYFLDPDRAAPLLERQAKAAKVAARGLEQAGIQLTAGTAEDLIARGYTADEAQKFFTEMGKARGLYQEMQGEEALTEEQKIGAAFGYDVAAAQKLERRKSERLAAFLGGGGFARTTGATSGVIETAAGGPQ